MSGNATLTMVASIDTARRLRQQMASTTFQSESGSDDLWVRANDGFEWSAWTEFQVNAPLNHVPVVTAADFPATHDQNIAANLAAAQGPDPNAWRDDANPERIQFKPGLLTQTMRWTNRPTFQQVGQFSGHRPR